MSDDRVLGKKYRLIRLLGEGGAGAVWEAENLLVGKRVAVKILHPALAEDPNLVARFLAEARAAAKIAHPHVVDVYDLGNDEQGRPYMVMELIVGETLHELIAHRGAVGASYACDLMMQVLSALDAAHEKGIVHRDLKPANIIVMHPRPDQAEVKVLDFGIAQGVFADGTAPEEAGLLFGTPEYISPEQATGGTVDARSDVYAAGAILFELLSGRPPFIGNSPVHVLAAVLGSDAPSLRSLAPKVPATLEATVMGALSKNPDHRPSSARELMQAITPFTTTRAMPSLMPERMSERPILLVKSQDRASPPPADPPKKKKAVLELVMEPSVPPPPMEPNPPKK